MSSSTIQTSGWNRQSDIPFPSPARLGGAAMLPSEREKYLNGTIWSYIAEIDCTTLSS